MATIVGQGDYKYEIIEDWAKLPDGWSFKEVAAVSVDKNDNVYAFSRGDHPMMVFDRNGNSCARGARGSIRGRMVSTWGPTIRST